MIDNRKTRLILFLIFFINLSLFSCQNVTASLEKVCVKKNNIKVRIHLKNESDHLYTINKIFDTQNKDLHANKIIIKKNDTVLNIPTFNFYRNRNRNRNRNRDEWKIKPHSAKVIELNLYKYLNKREAAGIYLISNFLKEENLLLKIDLMLKNKNGSIENVATNFSKIDISK